MPSGAPEIDLSIVSTLYRSSSYLRAFHVRAGAAAARVALEYEVILVDDGSPDDSGAIALELCRLDPRVGLIELSRNFGHHKAMMTGLAAARGRLVFLIDCDLEEDPTWLVEFDRVMGGSGADVVYGVQSRRKGRTLERWAGRIFYAILRVLTAEAIPANVVTARLMTRDYVRGLVRHRDREVFLAGLWATTGFRQVAVPVVKRSRGGTTYTLRRKLALMANAITSFSNRPLLFILYLGSAILALSGAAGSYLLTRRLMFGNGPTGWLALILSIWFLGGLGIFCQGILAVYLSKIFSEAKRRPYTVVRRRHGICAGTGGEHGVRRPRRAG